MKALLIRLKGDGILGQGGISKLHRERLPVEPNHRLAFGEALLTVERPLAKAEIAQPVQPARKATGKEDPVQIFWCPDMPDDLIEDFSRSTLPVFALPMRPMWLMVVGIHPSLVFQLGALPAGHLGKIEVSKPSL